MLSEHGYGGLSVEAVAAEAGIAKSTLYRHWRSKMDLVSDALETLNVQPREGVDHGSMTERIVALIRHLSQAMRDSLLSRCIPALVEAAEHHDEVARFLHDYSARRRKALEEAIDEGVRRGEFAESTDPHLAAIALSGAVMYRRLLTGTPFDPVDAESLVEAVLKR